MRRIGMALAILATACPACGDNAEPAGVPLAPAPRLAIVAHQDDDLLFMQPDMVEAEHAGEAITIVYVTAGDDQRSLAYVEGRYAGLRAGYSELFGSTDWQCGPIAVLGHAAEHCRLAAAQLSLVFLGYPDGGKPGDSPHSLLRLWQGEIANATTVAAATTTYDRAQLIDVLANIMQTTAPTQIMTLEIASTHGEDHSDHMLAGALALLARPSGAPDAALVSYRGYDRADEPQDVLEPVAAAAEPGYAYYTSCADGCAACGTKCPSYSATYSGWIRRRYAVNIARPAHGFVADANGQCLTDALGVGGCATEWELGSALRSNDRCVAVAADGSLSLGDCAAATPIAFDDEDHIWFALPPAPGPNMATDHLLCLGEDAGVPRAMLCGANGAPSWTVTSAITSTPRPFAGALTLGDFDGDTHADVCAVEAGMLRCARGDGHGGFAAPTTIGALAVDPASLMIRDGLVCGSDSDGILCTTGSDTFRFTSAFATGTATSLAIDPTANAICGLTSDGFACAGRDQAAIVRSPYPVGAPLLIGDLDGDHLTDWCITAGTGPVCGLASDAALSTDGISRAFSLAGVVEHASAIGALGDLDGDGRADLCTLDTAVRCSTSQGVAFGPEHVELKATGTALFLVDLDGDERAEPCVDTGSAIVCPSR